jgi:ADP-ribosylglycohydrolase/protein-tyrosine phosphatase
MKTQDRFRGALLGLAVGDAIGTTLEFRPPGSFTEIDDMVGRGPFNLVAGEWTDDTSMALCLAESLIEKREFDPIDQLERYTQWAKHGHLSSNGRVFDIGNTVRAALTKFAKTHRPYCGSSDTFSAGNGSLMRLAPVPLFFLRSPLEAIERSGDSSRTTHGAQTAIDACRYSGGLIVGAALGVTKEELLSDRFSPVKDYWSENRLAIEIDEIAVGSFRRLKPPEIKGDGYVVKSLEAALWAFHSSDSFREGCLLAVNLGNDADTTGAIFGQLAGAFYGEDEIPEEWRRKLTQAGLITSFADSLYRHRVTERTDRVELPLADANRQGATLVGSTNKNKLMPPKMTNASHPLRIESLSLGQNRGCIGMTPGKKQDNAQSGAWDRDLDADMDMIKAFGAKALVTLMPNSELGELHVSPRQLRDKASVLGVEWIQLPISDQGIPDAGFDDLWSNVGRHLHELLKAGNNIVIHCKGGLGRTGTIAARLLIEFGADPKTAIQSVRKARPGAIENKLQEEYILRLNEI